MKLYLAGPMRGLPEYNYPTFNRYAQLLRERGFEVFNPAEAHGGDTTLKLEEYFATDLPQVCLADAVAVLPGWNDPGEDGKRRGSEVEVEVARYLGKAVYNAVLLASSSISEDVLFEEARIEEPQLEFVEEDLYEGETFVAYGDNPERQRSVSGGVKDNRSKPPLDLLPYEPLVGAARVLAYGAHKYKPHNWRLGLSWTQTWSSLQRHLWSWINGEDIDPETSLPHLDHAMCQLLFLSTYAARDEYAHHDDRWSSSDHDEARA